MRLHPLLWLLLGASALSIACASVRVRTDFDEAVDFARYQSFAWLEPPLREQAQPEGLPGDPFTRNTLLDKRVRAAVEKALLARGFRAAGDDAPDFQVRYEIVSREVRRDSPVFVSGGYGRYGYYGSGVGYTTTTSYQEGTLILDVIDPATHQITWRGWAPSQTRDGHIPPERLVKTVDAILSHFPPGVERAQPEE